MTPLLDTAPESLYDELDFNQNEETNHIKLWIKFANALGVSAYDLEVYNGLEKTTMAIGGLFSINSPISGATFPLDMPAKSLLLTIDAI